MATTEGAWVGIPVQDGKMDAWHHPGSGDRLARLVMLQEIFGVNEAMRATAAQFAERGFDVLVPDLFWRLEPRVQLGYTDADRKRGFELMQRFDFARGVQDIADSARWLAGSGGGKIGLIGFCLGGRLAVEAAGAYDFKAVIALYGIKLETVPAKLLALQAPFQLHVGDRDAHVPAEAVAAIGKILAGKKDAEVFVYPGAQHGFFNPVRAEVFDAEAAAAAMYRITKQLSSSLT